MALPDIDFYAIREHRGSRDNAFEELCCQLANEEPIAGRTGFYRKGPGGDGGVECFATLADGTEVGWQVKFYSDPDSMLVSLGKSLDKALQKHPAMTKFVACFPFDLADSRKEGVTTALDKWSAWRARRIEDALRAGRTIAIEKWDAHEIKLRLTDANARSAGRIAFWFDQEMLSPEWSKKAFARVVDSLGERYSPQSHIDLPIRQTILAAVRDPSLFEELAALAERIDGRLMTAPKGGDGGALAAAAEAVRELRRLASQRDEPFSAQSAMTRVEGAADLAQAWHDDLGRGVASNGRLEAHVVAVSNVVSSLRSTMRALRAERWQHLDTRKLLVVGAAGTGKSHLLADACAYQIERDRPALMVLGGKLPDAEPWSEIMKDLDLPRHLQVKHFLGALNAAGEASGVRALVAIDALNEKNGLSIWPERLPSLLSDLREFPWITVVLSCRSTYVDLVVPHSLDSSKLPRIVHEGFNDEDVVRYLGRHGISIPETPRQLLEFRNPLFLRLVCSAIGGDGEVLVPAELAGVSDALALFTSAIVRRVEATLEVPPKRAVVRTAIEAMAKEMSDTGRGQIGFGRADELLRAIHTGSDTTHDLLFQLENEGLVAVEHDHVTVPGENEIVRFTFERVGDHAIAASLLKRSIVGREPAKLCEPGSPLRDALSDANSQIVVGVVAAMAVQLPEQFAIELPDLENLPDTFWGDGGFRDSLLIRAAASFRPRTWELVEAQNDSELRYETLIALATEPDHPFNVAFLDAELRQLAMPERDAAWTSHLAFSERARDLVTWAWTADQSRVTGARAELAARQLTWFLTATQRPLRDKATKALVAILTGRADLATKLWAEFKDLDDPYVTERVVAAIFGAAMQGRWSKASLTEVANQLYEDLFAGGSPPANSLLRDHALGMIALARLRGEATNTIDPARLEPPFKSAWPIEHVSDAMIDTYGRDYGNGSRGHDQIVDSCLDGDFGRYVLDYAVQDWSPAPIGTVPLPNALELREAWFAEFSATATPEMLDAHDALVATLEAENPDEKFIHGEARDRVRAAKAAFRSAVGPDRFEEWREKAEHWRAEGMYQSFAMKGPAGISLAWARRWIVMRAHELGWSEALHGRFDQSTGHDRNEHSLERIGKKYQWLALYELVARMGDNLARIPGHDDDGLRLRNIDPSLLVERTYDDGFRRFDQKAFWTGTPPNLPARTPAEAIAWLHSDEDVLDAMDNVDVSSRQDGRDWLVLSNFETWRSETSGFHIEAWRRVGCVVVRAEDAEAALKLLSGVHFTSNHDLPTAEGADFRVHLGEYPWRTLAPDHDDWIDDWRPVRSDRSSKVRLAVRPTTAEYRAEANGYDGSIDENVNLVLPARWIMDGLDLHLSDGRSIQYQDAAGVVRFLDPSVAEAGRSAALVDRNAFLDLLQSEGLVAIWAVAGEKNAYGNERDQGFGGRFTFTRLLHSDGQEIRADGRHDSYEEPSSKQRAAFLRAASAEPS